MQNPRSFGSLPDKTLEEGAAESFAEIREKAVFDGDDIFSDITEENDVDPTAESLADLMASANIGYMPTDETSMAVESETADPNTSSYRPDEVPRPNFNSPSGWS